MHSDYSALECAPTDSYSNGSNSYEMESIAVTYVDTRCDSTSWSYIYNVVFSSPQCHVSFNAPYWYDICANSSLFPCVGHVIRERFLIAIH